jgi:hypothetical protein
VLTVLRDLAPSALDRFVVVPGKAAFWLSERKAAIPTGRVNGSLPGGSKVDRV